MRHRESNLQKACVTWFRYQFPGLRNMLFAVPNGGYRSKVEAGIMKAEGVVPGVSDLILLVPMGGYGALCLEMKDAKGKQSKSQREWQLETEKVGNKYAVCRSIIEFMNVVNEYLNDKRNTNKNTNLHRVA